MTILPPLHAVLLVLLLAAAPAALSAQPKLIEVHQRIATDPASTPQLALTLDACSGQFDAPLLEHLIAQRIPATLFVTRRWLRRNPQAIALIKQHLDLFAIENHGANHVPALIGAERSVYGLKVHADLPQLEHEVHAGAHAIRQAFGTSPRWYRGATAIYDRTSIAAIHRLGYQVAGFSLNADHGARSGQAAIVRRLQAAQAGDVIIAHMNHPESGTAAGLIGSLSALRARGFVFVRLDRVQLREIAPPAPHRAARAP